MRQLRIFILFGLTNIFFTGVFAQKEELKNIRTGNKQYHKEEFNGSEISYRNALVANPGSYKAIFNLGNTLYKQEKYDEAQDEFNALTGYEKKEKDLAKVYHNLGNSYLKKDQYKESIEAYKQALKFNPDDADTKYNLAYAQKKMQLQQQQNQCNNQQDQDQDKEQDKNQQQEQQNQNKEQEQNKKEQQQQQEQQISRQDAERMLEALENDEKNLQDKLKLQQVQSQQVKIEKDW